MLHDKFSEARARQPSLVLIDNLESWLPVLDTTYVDTFCTEVDKLRGSRVLIIAACSSHLAVHSAVQDPYRITRRLELPIPDQPARKHILKVLLGSAQGLNVDLAASIGRMTHGFTGKDLAALVEAAEYRSQNRRHRYMYPDGEASTEESEISRIKLPSLSLAESQDSERDSYYGCDPMNSGLTIYDFKLALDDVHPTALREIFVQKPTTQWCDIGGSADIRAKFDKIVGYPLWHPKMMIKWHVRSSKGVLLYGPPGCSKTLTAQAVAHEYGLNFISVKGAELLSMYVGESERKVREIFDKARNAAPCIIFFDEIDAIASSREENKGLNVVTTLLTEMDGFNELKGVLVLAATNKPEALDPAIMRPGRFDSHVYLTLPTTNARADIINMQTASLPHEEAFNLRSLVEITEGYTGAELVAVCRLATGMAMERDITDGPVHPAKLIMADFHRAVEQVPRRVTGSILATYESFVT